MQELVVAALMVSLVMVMFDELVDELAYMSLAKRDHATETLLSDRADEPLGIGVEIGTLRWQPNRLDTATRQDLAEDTRVQGIAVVDQMGRGPQTALHRGGQIAGQRPVCCACKALACFSCCAAKSCTCCARSSIRAPNMSVPRRAAAGPHVADPRCAPDLRRICERALSKEFDDYRGFTRKLTRFVSKSSAAASAARGRPWTTRRFSPSTGRLRDRVIDEDQKAPDVARSGHGAQPGKCVALSMRPRDALNRRH